MRTEGLRDPPLSEASLHEDIMGGYEEEDIPEEKDSYIGEVSAEAVYDGPLGLAEIGIMYLARAPSI